MGERTGAGISVYGSWLESFSVEMPGGVFTFAGIMKPVRLQTLNWPFRRVSCRHRGLRLVDRRLPAQLLERQRISEAGRSWNLVFVDPGGPPSLRAYHRAAGRWGQSSDPWHEQDRQRGCAAQGVGADERNAGVKYFSGVGTYTGTFEASPEWFRKGAHLWIDLGDVKNLAVITVNGKNLGEAWHAPYRVDATAALRPDANRIEIEVVNAWVNRLIGDQQPSATKYAYADIAAYRANSPLQVSGLIGPVTVVREGPQPAQTR